MRHRRDKERKRQGCFGVEIVCKYGIDEACELHSCACAPRQFKWSLECISKHDIVGGHRYKEPALHLNAPCCPLISSILSIKVATRHSFTVFVDEALDVSNDSTFKIGGFDVEISVCTLCVDLQRFELMA